ncbi:MAG TPA: M48 family metalloprotease, partial [Blastocatellia bacterium]|nr:M48 family metalloprotease [Blastocatellia bacterium]
ILGAIIGGNVGGVIAQGTQLGVSAYFLKYSRDYERQADILGAQIMARAGYDPRDLANMFRTIERQSGGSGGPEWLSSHPNPGNRYEAIVQEAERLRVNRNAARFDGEEFNRVQSGLRRQSPAPTMQEIAQRGAGRQSGGRQYPADSRIEQQIESPSTRFRTQNLGNIAQVGIPSNWERFEDGNSVTFAPRGAYGNYQGQSVFTHGAIVGVVNAQTNNLSEATDRYVNGLLQSNSYLQPQSRYQRTNIGGQRALFVRLAGRSPVTGQTEIVTVYTAMMRNGQLFNIVTVAPDNDFRQYDQVFAGILRSVQLNG